MNQQNTKIEQELIALRREFHRYPESGWTEFRTTARIIEELEKLGLPVWYGQQIHKKEKMFGLPASEVLERCFCRAVEEGVRPELLEAMRGGFTGCVTVIEGALPGPVTGIRVDIDCNDVEESLEEAHRPVREGFASVHENCMHACGHDAHAAIGIGVAKLLCENRDSLQGKVVLAFQPAEEGLRGAASLVEAGVFDSCNRLFSLHVGLMDTPVGTVAASAKGFLASTKLDVTFHGVAAHAGMDPEKGRNALAAAAKATLELLQIPERFTQLCRVNVGTLHAGTGRNVIPARAELQIETRGATTEVNEAAEAAVKQICAAASEQFGCTCEIHFAGSAGGGVCDAALAETAANCLKHVEGVTEVRPVVELRVGEDVTTIMRRVQNRGGQATELVLGMPLPYPHHNGRFDVDERLIGLGARCLAALALET